MKDESQTVIADYQARDLKIDPETGKYYVMSYKPQLISTKAMTLGEVLDDLASKPGMIPQEYTKFQEDNKDLLGQFFAGGGAMIPIGFGSPQFKTRPDKKEEKYQKFEKLIQEKFAAKGYQDVLTGFRGTYFCVDFFNSAIFNQLDIDDILLEAKAASIELTFQSYHYSINPYSNKGINREYNHSLYFLVKYN